MLKNVKKEEDTVNLNGRAKGKRVILATNGNIMNVLHIKKLEGVVGRNIVVKKKDNKHLIFK